MHGDWELRNSSGLLACQHDSVLPMVENEHNLNKSHQSLLVAAKQSDDNDLGKIKIFLIPMFPCAPYPIRQ